LFSLSRLMIFPSSLHRASLVSVAANHVLEQALAPENNGVPENLLNEDLKGIILISVVEVGFIFSGNVGTGIVMSRDSFTPTWSTPCAVGLTGIGVGLLVGESVKDLMIFIYSHAALDAVSSESGLKMGGQAELTLGNFGRSGQVNCDMRSRGVGETLVVAFSKGAFVGLSVEGSVVGARHAINERFYGKPCTPHDIMMQKDRDNLPEGKMALIREVYDKLNKLSGGETRQPEMVEEDEKVAAKAEFDIALEAANAAADFIQVDDAAGEEEKNVADKTEADMAAEVASAAADFIQADDAAAEEEKKAADKAESDMVMEVANVAADAIQEVDAAADEEEKKAGAKAEAVKAAEAANAAADGIQVDAVADEEEKRAAPDFMQVDTAANEEQRKAGAKAEIVKAAEAANAAADGIQVEAVADEEEKKAAPDCIQVDAAADEEERKACAKAEAGKAAEAAKVAPDFIQVDAAVSDDAKETTSSA
jgi:lipid-binding SYLF domain-containing protein